MERKLTSTSMVIFLQVKSKRKLHRHVDIAVFKQKKGLNQYRSTFFRRTTDSDRKIQTTD